MPEHSESDTKPLDDADRDQHTDLQQKDPIHESEMKALTEAFQQFTNTTKVMEESYRRLEARLESLDNELQQKHQELAVTTDYLDSVLESMSDGLVAIDTKGIITTFNHAASRILDFPPVEIVGTPYIETFGEPFSISEGPRAADLPTKTDGVVPVSIKSSPLSDRSGKNTGTVIVFQDLTEIEALREQVRRKDRLAAIGEMAATVAHEIRNPLGGIRGFAALLQQDIEPGDPRARLVEKIITGTKNLNRVVDELLEYTRPVELRLKIVDCAGLLDSAIGTLDHHDTVNIANNIASDLKLHVDPDKVHRALLNILINAVQSVESLGTVHVNAETSPEGLTISIQDSGCGIPEEFIDSVFSPFFTTKEKGTGLGLAVASKTIEGHGGNIQVTSKEGKGSTFYVFIPNNN